MQRSDELWEQDYQEIIGSIPDLIFDDIPDSSSSPKAMCKGTKGCIGKPVRRRSRTSNKSPTTLLKADANNFRALVQRFTGCHSATPQLRAYKGPINLNFKHPEKQQQMQVESDGGSLFPLIGAESNVAGDEEDRVGQNPRADVDSFWRDGESAPGDYSTLYSSGSINHEFWGY